MPSTIYLQRHRAWAMSMNCRNAAYTCNKCSRLCIFVFDPPGIRICRSFFQIKTLFTLRPPLPMLNKQHKMLRKWVLDMGNGHSSQSEMTIYFEVDRPANCDSPTICRNISSAQRDSESGESTVHCIGYSNSLQMDRKPSSRRKTIDQNLRR